MAATSATGMGMSSHRAHHQDLVAPMIAKSRVISIAIILTSVPMLLLPHKSVHAFSPQLNIAHPSGTRPSSSSSPSFVPTQLLVLQPSKGGIIVEAKSDYVARDILIDGFMGRDSASSSSEKELGWREPQHNLDSNDNFAPNESSWLQSPNNRRMGQQQQQVQVQKQHSQFQSASVPVPPSLPPKTIITQPQQQQFLAQQSLSSSSTTKQSATINSTSGNTKSKLPDPSLMKLSDIQGELSLRRIAYNDCFDRTSLEAKLREARLAMMKTTPLTPTTTTLTSPRASPAEQAIFSSSFASTRSATSASSTSSRVATPTISASSPLSSNGNPFRRQSGVKNNNRGGQNSSSSFRDNSHGIGFGDANSYYSSVGPRGGGSGNSGGDGVRLGKQRTSYGEFGGSGSGRTSLSGNSVSAGGSTSVFNISSNGGVAGDRGGRDINNNFGTERKLTPFAVGGMSIKGDSSIFSSAGFVGQQGTVINAFHEKDGSRSTAGSFMGVTSRNTPVSTGGAAEGDAGSGEAVSPPVPPLEEPKLDWLVQDRPENKHDFLIDSVWDPPVTNYDAIVGNHAVTNNDAWTHHDLNAQDDHEFPTSYNFKWMSQQYQEQGLDFLSGGQEGFGAIKGIESSGGGSDNRASANDNLLQRNSGGPGNAGVTMGGDFDNYGNRSFGDGHRRSSARYSGGDGIDNDD